MTKRHHACDLILIGSGANVIGYRYTLLIDTKDARWQQRVGRRLRVRSAQKFKKSGSAKN
jgi:hypothetical protein